MGVGVLESRHQKIPVAVDDFHILLDGEAHADLRNPIPDDQDIAKGEGDMGEKKQQTRVPEQNLGHKWLLRFSRNDTPFPRK